MQLISIRRSRKKGKKYDADVIYKGQLYEDVSFGAIGYEQYRDSTPLKLYSHMDHNDEERRKRFHARHKKNTGIASQLSKLYLW